MTAQILARLIGVLMLLSATQISNAQNMSIEGQKTTQDIYNGLSSQEKQQVQDAIKGGNLTDQQKHQIQDAINKGNISLPSDVSPADVITVINGLSPQEVSQLKAVASELGVKNPDEFVDKLKKSGSLDELAKSIQEQRVNTNRFVDGHYPPIGMKIGLEPQFTSVTDEKLRADLSAIDPKSLRQLERSVGRIETADDEGNYLPFATGFVIGSDLIATNCHVAEDISEADAVTGRWMLKKDSRAVIDFAADRSHQDSNHFAITELVGISSTPGFDVAILRIKATPEQNVPTRLEFGNATSKEIFIVGYPNLETSEADKETRQAYQELIKQKDVARVLSPGLIVDSTSVADIPVIKHLASTKEGNSGSPVFDVKTLKVVGVHFCCFYVPSSATTRGANVLSSDAGRMPCALPKILDPLTNEAISSSAVLSQFSVLLPTVIPTAQTTSSKTSPPPASTIPRVQTTIPQAPIAPNPK